MGWKDSRNPTLMPSLWPGIATKIHDPDSVIERTQEAGSAWRADGPEGMNGAMSERDTGGGVSAGSEGVGAGGPTGGISSTACGERSTLPSAGVGKPGETVSAAPT